ncbi:transglycosylase SLT domain-containing protein [Fodinicola acaciae]|uniref:transglycosylase SLT domain-containing protein n=1 Tax=Fodinicola acaciae TaxID=2681555 RepID=UPI0013D20824|nr:transglycosylase SLT domain-containing protein [Fodinicola acaciae]
MSRRLLALLAAVFLAAAGLSAPAYAATGADLCAQVGLNAGFPRDRLVTAVAVALAESRCNPLAKSPPNHNGTIDRGLWQINSGAHPEVSDACAYDAQCNANAAYRISSGGTNWQPWSTYNNGAYRAYLSEAQAAVDRLGSQPPKRKHVDGDVSGDGSADLLATKTDGSLIYCPNNAAVNPDHLPFMDCVTTGGGWQNATKVVEGDVSGDGSVDIVAAKSDGSLIYCPNNAAVNPDHLPFMDCAVTGSGWGSTVTHMFLGDVSGDGSADLLATKTDGSLIYCPNNAAVNPGHVPFLDCATTGGGWDPAHVTNIAVGDVSGDGSVDILATKTDGSLIYCPNNAATNPGHLPFMDCVTTGNGWTDTAQIFAADVSGDGSADLLAIKSDGTLVYCPNNAAVNPGHLPFMDCANTGSGWQPSNATHVLAVDVSGDGSVDLLASKADGSLIYCPNNAATNPGHAPFVSCVTTGNGWQPSQVTRLLANNA